MDKLTPQEERIYKTIRRTLSLQEKIMCDVDDEIYALKKKIQKRHKLKWEKARDYTNYSLRVLMLGFPEKWVKK